MHAVQFKERKQRGAQNPTASKRQRYTEGIRWGVDGDNSSYGQTPSPPPSPYDETLISNLFCFLFFQLFFQPFLVFLKNGALQFRISEAQLSP